MEDINFEDLFEMADTVDVDFGEEVEAITVEEQDPASEEVGVEETPELEGEDEPAPIVRQESNVFSTVELLMDSGRLSDMEVTLEDGTTVLLSEFKDIDAETLKTILQESEKQDKETLNTDYVKIKDVDEIKKSLINIILKGDLDEVKELFSNPEVLKDPFEGYNNSNEVHNVNVYYAYLTKAQGHSKDEAELLIEAAKKSNTLDSKALKIVETHRADFKRALEEKQKAIEAEKQEQKERVKTYAKDLEETYKQYGLTPEKTLELKKLATSFDKDGNLPVDSLYDQMMSSPETAADLLLFISDKALYDKRVFEKAKTETNKEVVRKIQISKNINKKTQTKEIEKRQDNSNPFEGLIID